MYRLISPAYKSGENMLLTVSYKKLLDFHLFKKSTYFHSVLVTVSLLL